MVRGRWRCGDGERRWRCGDGERRWRCGDDEKEMEVWRWWEGDGGVGMMRGRWRCGDGGREMEVWDGGNVETG